jgi:vitamin B12 transporter
VLILTLILAHAGFAQAGATVEFRATIHGVAISATLWPLDKTVSSDVNGTVRFSELSAGEYRAEVNASGYAPVDTAFQLAPGDMRQFNIALRAIPVLPDVVVEARKEGSETLVFDRKDMAASSSPSLAEFLEREAGLDVRSDGIPGATRTVRVGASNPNQVLVLLDGRRIQDFGSGSADLSGIPLDWIEKVEVYRGGQTAQSGEAIGGIVNIVTRDPTAAQELTAQTNWRETHQQLSLTRSATMGKAAGLLTYSRLQGPGDYRYRIITDDGTGQFTPNLGQSYHRLNADVARDQIMLKLAEDISTVWKAAITGMLDRAERGMPGYLTPYLTPDARQETSQSALNANLTHHVDTRDIVLRGSYQQAWKDFRNPDPLALVKHSEETSRDWEAEARVNQTWRRAVIGAGSLAAREMLSGDHLAGENVTRERWAMWGQWEQQYSILRTLSLRSEFGAREEGFGSQRALLPRVSVSADYVRGWHTGATAAWGESYRAPDFYALFWQEDQSAQGNPELRAEESREWTGHAYVETAGGHSTRFEINASAQRIENLIFWRRTFENQWKPFNLTAANVKTLDAALTQSMLHECVRIQLAANWTDARDATHDRNTGGKFLTFRPLNSQRAMISYVGGRVRTSVDYRRVSKRAVLESNSKWLSAYQLVDARIGYRVQLRRVELEPEIGVDNLFNEDYRILRFAPMPEREWYAALRLAVGEHGR